MLNLYIGYCQKLYTQHCHFLYIVNLLITFAFKLEENEGNQSNTLYFINKENYYPIRMRVESYSSDNLTNKMFLDQRYYDIKFNLLIEDDAQFNTSDKSIQFFEKREMQP